MFELQHRRGFSHTIRFPMKITQRYKNTKYKPYDSVSVRAHEEKCN